MNLVFANLVRRWVRSFLAVLGVAIGIAAVVGLVSLTRGFRNELDDMLIRLRGDVIVKQKDAVTPQTSRIDETTVRAMAHTEGVAGASGYTVQGIVFGEFQVPVYGFDPGDPILSKVHVESGRRIAPDGYDEVMLGSAAARNLGLHAGSTLTVPPSDPDGQKVKVVGIYHTGSRYQDFGAIVHLRTAQMLGGIPGKVMMAAIDVEPDADPVAVRDRLRAAHPGLEVLLAREYTDNLVDFELVTKFIWAISVIAAVVGAIGVLNTMFMSVVERTREIGMLLAVGWSRPRVLGMVLVEGLVVSVLGGVLGIGLGVLLVHVVIAVLQELPIVPGHDAALFGEALALAIGLGLLGSLLPAWKASRLSPIEALRHE